MAGTSTSFGIVEGQSSHRPPPLDGTNYAYWKNRMRFRIKSQDERIWDVIEEGNYVPMKKSTTKVGTKDITIKTAKSKAEWTEEDYRRVAFNNKAINFLHCAILQNDYMKISTCETAKEIWDKLSITYEGISHVKDAKIDRLIHEYELFKMKDGEKVEDMLGRFSNNVTNLNLLGKKMTEKEIVNKILRSLTSR